MYGEQGQFAQNAGKTIRVEARVLTDDEALRLGFPHNSGLDGRQVTALGYDALGNVTGIVPIVLTNNEMDEAIKNIKNFNKMLQEAVKTAKPDFKL